MLRGRRRWKRVLAWVTLAVLALFVLIQAVPYGRNHSNPRVTAEPVWVTAQTRSLAVRACFDCHSNQTRWRWYSNIAPASWLIQRDVDAGRAQFNFSEWNRPQDVSSGDMAEAIRGGSMPPWFYVLLHPSSGRTRRRTTLHRGLKATLAAILPRPGGGWAEVGHPSPPHRVERCECCCTTSSHCDRMDGPERLASTNPWRYHTTGCQVAFRLRAPRRIPAANRPKAASERPEARRHVLRKGGRDAPLAPYLRREREGARPPRLGRHPRRASLEPPAAPRCCRPRGGRDRRARRARHP